MSRGSRGFSPSGLTYRENELRAEVRTALPTTESPSIAPAPIDPRVAARNHVLLQIQGATESRVRHTRTSPKPIRDPVFVAGEADPTLPGGLTDGVSFTAGQTKEVFCGLGRAPIGFMVVDVQGTAPSLVRTTSGLTAGLEKTHIALIHSGAGTTRVKLLVF